MWRCGGQGEGPGTPYLYRVNNVAGDVAGTLRRGTAFNASNEGQ